MRRLAPRGWGAFALLAATWACAPADLGPLLSEPVCGEGCPDAGPTPDSGVAETCTATTSLACGLGVCARVVAACVDGRPNTCEPGPAGSEACNDLDDNCDGQIDEGCDDDRDGYCDQAMVVTSTPAVCRKGGTRLLDCDDQQPARHQGRPEICDDGLDNDCNDFADYLDVEGCVHLTASFQDADGVVTLEHGTSQVVQAVLTPPSLALERRWVVTSAAPDQVCAPSDVTLTEPQETPAITERRVAILDDPSRLDCAYRLELQIGGTVADTLELRMRNSRPRVEAIEGASLDDQAFVLTLAEGSNPRLLATATADPDAPVVIRWAGRDVGLLDCGSPCETDQLHFRNPPAAGSYQLIAAAKDAFDGIERTRNVRVEVVRCTWARSGGTGTGVGPAQAEAFGSLGNALTAAATAGGDVCLAGTGRIGVGANLTLPLGVGIRGGFGTTGLPATTLGALRLNNGAQLRFAAGHSGSIRRVIVDGTAPGSGLFQVIDASPSFYGVELVLPPGDGARGISFATTTAQPATLRLGSVALRTNGATSNAVGVEVHGQGSGVARLVWNGGGTVDVLGCSGVCRGLWLHGATSAALTAERILVESSGPGGQAIAVDLASEGSRRTTAELTFVAQIWAGTTTLDPADETVAIRLDHTEGVRIADNGSIGATTHTAGRRFAAAIADGKVERDGRVSAGASTGLTIRNNRQIGPGRADYSYGSATCNEEPSVREGSDVSVGVLLVGTSSATIQDNGSTGARDNGIFGGASSGAFDGNSGRVLAPAAIGLWTLDTRATTVEHNELRPGALVLDPACPPAILPATVAIRDGLPVAGPNRHGSTGLVLTRNGVVTSRRLSFDALPNLDLGPTHLVELLGDAASTVAISNSYLAVTRGTELAALWVDGAAQVDAWNNVFDVDSSAHPGRATKKQAVVLLGASAPRFTLANAILWIREEAEDPSDAVALTLAGSDPRLARLDHNLFFVEAAERSGTGAYVTTADGARYDRSHLPDFATPDFATANQVLPPLFRAQALEHRRSMTRLTVRSPGVDQGLSTGAPGVDFFGAPRPIGPAVDVGHHEFGPGD